MEGYMALGRRMKTSVGDVALRRGIATGRHGWTGIIFGKSVRFIPRVGSINGKPSGWWMAIIHRPGDLPIILTEGQQGECYTLNLAVEQARERLDPWGKLKSPQGFNVWWTENMCFNCGKKKTGRLRLCTCDPATRQQQIRGD